MNLDNVKVYTFGEGRWTPNTTVCRPSTIAKLKGKLYFQKGYLITEQGKVIVYTNNPKADFISKDVQEKHSWEPHVFNTIYKHIRHDPDIAIIDMGANIGAITLQLANIGRRVIALEALPQMTKHVCAGVAENGFADRVTIIHNALSNTNDDVKLTLPANEDFGLAFIDQGDVRDDMAKLWGADTWGKKTVTVKATTLDDLVTLPEYKSLKKVFIKIDIQGFEHKILETSKKFFDDGKLQGFYMEWYWHRSKPSGDFMLRVFSDWNFEPFDCNSVLFETSSDLNKDCVLLDVTRSGTWPTDVLWLPKRAQIK